MLTKKQYDLLLFIHKRVQKDGVSPSFDEMKAALDLRSKSGIHRLITALEERGFIRRLAHRARAIEILRLPDNVADSAPRGGFRPSVIEGDLVQLLAIHLDHAEVLRFTADAVDAFEEGEIFPGTAACRSGQRNRAGESQMASSTEENPGSKRGRNNSASGKEEHCGNILFEKGSPEHYTFF